MGKNIIRLQGFKVDDKVLVCDRESLGDYEKIEVVMSRETLEFLITEKGLLNGLNIDIKTL